MVFFWFGPRVVCWHVKDFTYLRERESLYCYLRDWRRWSSSYTLEFTLRLKKIT
jgi:hypothetical protein